MDREIVLVTLAMVVCGPTLLLSALWPPARICKLSARDQERICWWRLWLPLMPIAIETCALSGWASQEPRNAEPVPLWMVLAGLPLAATCIRTLTRGVRALVCVPRGVPAGTVGLFRPRVVVSPHFQKILDRSALNAACEHEAAHARHYDPLRIWLAQLAVDLQWPCAPARRRWTAWLQALELARDEEARSRGVDGADLAAAIVAAQRLSGCTNVAPLASLTGDPDALRARVARLLSPTAACQPQLPARRGWLALLLSVTFAVAVVFGALYGEAAAQIFLRGAW